MSSETIPATTDTPNSPAVDTPRRSTLAALMQPVEPVRSIDTATLDADTDSDSGTGEDLDSSGSSTSYKSDDGDTSDSSTTQSKSVVRAWLLAGAQRWAKGGGTANKRLDVKKARAQARQVKTTETVNRTPVSSLLAGGGAGGKQAPNKAKGPSGGGGRGSGAGGSGGKNGASGSSGSKGPLSKKQPSGTPSGTASGAGKSGNGAGGAGGRGNSGGGKPKTDRSANGGGKGLDKTRTKTPAGGKNEPRPWQNRDTKTPGGAPSKGSDTKNQPKTPAPKQEGDSTGKSGKTLNTGDKNQAPKTPKTGPNAPAPKPASSKNTTSPKQPTSKKSPVNTKGPADLNIPKGLDTKTKQTPGAGPQNQRTKPSLTKRATDLLKKPTPAPDTKTLAAPKPPEKTTHSDDKKTPAPGTGTKTPDPKTPPVTGKQRRTQKAREHGYRHGTAIGEATTQTRAYRDGIKDGIKDRTERAAREKREMDAIHARRKQNQEKPVNATSADHKPAPIPAQASTDGRIQLGDGANRTSIGRGEVRNLKQYQDRLNTKTDTMTRIAEGAIQLQSHATDHATQATRILEAAKQVKGGDKLAAKLADLEDKAKVQAARAEEIHKRAVRAADACKALHANAETRYGAMFKAVADSDENAPADMHFYKQ